MANKNFVIKNGIEVNTDLIYGDINSGMVGINTTIPTEELDIIGTVKSLNSIVSGITTTVDIIITGNVSFGSSIGVVGQVPIKTGYGQTWVSPNNVPKTSTLFTATAGQTVFSVTYGIGLIDVYVNGVKLPSTEFTANNETSVILNIPVSGGDTVEFNIFNPVF